MPWKLPADKDEPIQKWMKANGLEVSDKDYDTGKRVYTWLHERPRGKPLGLQISQEVLDDNAAFVVLEHLDRLSVARAIRENPETSWVVRQQGTTVVLAGSA